MFKYGLFRKNCVVYGTVGLSLHRSVFCDTSAIPASSVEQLSARSHSLSSAGSPAVRSAKLVAQEGGREYSCLATFAP